MWNDKFEQGSFSRSIWKKFPSLQFFYTHPVTGVTDKYELWMYYRDSNFRYISHFHFQIYAFSNFHWGWDVSIWVAEMCSLGVWKVPFWVAEMCQFWVAEMCRAEVNYNPFKVVFPKMAKWHIWPFSKTKAIFLGKNISCDLGFCITW